MNAALGCDFDFGAAVTVLTGYASAGPGIYQAETRKGKEGGLDASQAMPREAMFYAYTRNAARAMNLDSIGTIAPGKQADLVVINGDPATKISDIEHVELVFKDGIAYDSAKLIESVKGSVGSH